MVDGTWKFAQGWLALLMGGNFMRQTTYRPVDVLHRSSVRGRTVRGLEEEKSKHRLRVEHNRIRFLHVSDEDGKGWTTLAIDRVTRRWAVAQRPRQLQAAVAAYEQLYSAAKGPKGAPATGHERFDKDPT
jgi:hypothetical protein